MKMEMKMEMHWTAQAHMVKAVTAIFLHAAF